MRHKVKTRLVSFSCFLFVLLMVSCTFLEFVKADCALDEFTCANKECILLVKKCNDFSDCSDGSDEGEICDCRDRSGKILFQCENSGGNSCVFMSQKCDGHRDCRLGEDEWDCEEDPLAVKCNSNEWLCEDKMFCIPLASRCDGTPVCADKSDEKNCNGTCNVFRCNNGKCLDNVSDFCNGIDDCGDNTDELHCNVNCTLENDLFRCSDNSSCLPLSKVCNGQKDCVDGSDEGPNCSKITCSSQKCPSDKCIQLPSGPICHCGKGFTSDHVRNTCEDIDECRSKDSPSGLCSHRCVNYPGTFRCECLEGFHLDPKDNRTCLSNTSVDSWIFFSTEDGIHKFNSEKNYSIRIIDQLPGVVAVAADDSFVYWSEHAVNQQRICRMHHHKTQVEEIAVNGVGSAEGLAVDWWTGNVYFTDNSFNHIAVCGNSGRSCLALITKGLDMPRGIAVHPLTAQLFWSDWGSRPHIGVSFMDGHGQKDLITDVHWPNGLAIDYPAERLYWVDAKSGKMESVKLNGADRRELHYHKDWHPFYVQVLGSKVFWTDKKAVTLNSMQKFTGDHKEVLFRRDGLRSLYTFHPLIQKKLEEKQNPCFQHPCEEICLLSEHSEHTCACSNGRLLGANEKCKYSRSTVLIGFGRTIYELEYEDVGVPTLRKSPQFQTPFKRRTFGFGRKDFAREYTVSRMVFNEVTRDLIVADNIIKEILQITRNGRRRSITAHIGKVSALAIDPEANNLYWTDSELQTVEMFSFRTQRIAMIHMFHKEVVPVSLAVAPKSGKLFVAVSTVSFIRSRMRIYKMALNGAGVTRLPNKWDLREADAEVDMEIDENNSAIYIANGKNILSWNYKQDQFLNFINSSSNIHQLTMVREGRRLFWTGDNGYIHWSTSAVHKSMQIPSEGSSPPSTIPISYLPSSAYNSSHACMDKNGGCSDICVNIGTTHSCLCGIGRTFKTKENRTCIDQIDCEFRCSDGACITHNRQCNGQRDCKDGSDEDLCTDKMISTNHLQCSYDNFKCRDASHCLDLSQKCDHHVDCADGSDELNCDTFNYTTRCHHHQFLCNITGICVDLSEMCDGVDDCGDGSDEKGCDLPKDQRRSCGNLFDCGNGQCVDWGWKCDGFPDCVNEMDEENCPKAFAECPAGFFMCHDSLCIELSLVCDGHSDCLDGLDEENCPVVGNHTKPENCDYQCKSDKKKCLKVEQVCDGITNCPRGEDEMNCTMKCSPGYFLCPRHGGDPEKMCIPHNFRCDGEKDCSGGEDEENCSKNGDSEATHVLCDKDDFACESGGCVSRTKVCDGEPDCPDHSDEGEKCKTACKSHNCEHFCVPYPTGPKCTCDIGYELDASDHRTCKDVNECLENLCSQECENTDGSFRCSCYPNFMLSREKIYCKAMGNSTQAIYSSGTQVRRFSRRTLKKEVIFQTFLDSEIFGMAVDMRRNFLYVSSMSQGVIYRVNMTNKKTSSVMVNYPERLAVDWGSGNIYLVHNHATGGTIKVCNFDSKKCATIITSSQFKMIEHLQIDSQNQLIFFVQVIEHFAFESARSLYQCRLDGTGKKMVYQPFPDHSTFTLDVHKKVFYFADPSEGTLTELSYDGMRERKITYELKDLINRGVTSMAFYVDEILLTVSGVNYNVHCPTTAKGSQSKRICHTDTIEVANVEHLFIVQETVQPKVKDVCANHRCSKICIPAGTGPKCVCGPGVQVGEGEECPEIDGSEDFLMGPDFQMKESSPFTGTDLEPSVGGRIALYVLLALCCVAGVTYYVYRKRYLMATFSITNSFTNVSLETSQTKDPPPVMYKPNFNIDPEGHAGSEITFDEKESNRSSMRSERSIIVSSTVSDDSVEFSDAVHLLK